MDHVWRRFRALSIHPGRAVLYSVPVEWAEARPSFRRQRVLTRDLDPAAKRDRNVRRIRNRFRSAAAWLRYRTRTSYPQLPTGRRVRFHAGFWTLTLPGDQLVDHKTFKRQVLDPWWTWLRNVHGIRHYLWSVELQKRGALHVHAVVLHWVPVADLERHWLHLCTTSGAVRLSPRYVTGAVKVIRAKHQGATEDYLWKYLGKELGADGDLGHRWGGSHSVTRPQPVRLSEVDDGDLVWQVWCEARRTGRHYWSGPDGVELFRLDPARFLRDEGLRLSALFAAAALAADP